MSVFCQINRKNQIVNWKNIFQVYCSICNIIKQTTVFIVLFFSFRVLSLLFFIVITGRWLKFITHLVSSSETEPNRNRIGLKHSTGKSWFVPVVKPRQINSPGNRVTNVLTASSSQFYLYSLISQITKFASSGFTICTAYGTLYV